MPLFDQRHMAADDEVDKDGCVASGATEDAEFVATPAKGVRDVGDASGIDFRYGDGGVVLHFLGVDKLGGSGGELFML